MHSAKKSSGYKLNSEVENPPSALQKASQIGLLKFFNPAMSELQDKDAIVILTFGTTFKTTREKNIDVIVQEIQAAHKNTKVVCAFTSHIVLKKIKQREGTCKYSTPEETLDKLLAEGYTRIVLASLALIPGIEYKYNVELFHEYKFKFKKISLATPLMYWQGQKNQADDVTEVLQSLKFPEQKADTAIFLMTHGTPDPSNAYYSVMQEKINLLRDDIFIYTVEGFPSLEDCIAKIKNSAVKKIFLMPFMLAAGNHVAVDMAGEEETSHKSILQRAGFEVETFLQGLGENKKIRELYLKRTQEACDALEIS